MDGLEHATAEAFTRSFRFRDPVSGHFFPSSHKEVPFSLSYRKPAFRYFQDIQDHLCPQGLLIY